MAKEAALALGYILLVLPALWGAHNRVHTYPQAHFRINAIAVGANGFLYLAGDSGLYSFDGFRYRRVDAYPFPVADEVAVARGGRLWAGSKIHGVAYQQDSGQFRIAFRERYHFATAVDNFLIVQDLRNRLLRFDSTGASEIIEIPHVMWPAVGGKELWLSCVDMRAVYRLIPDRMELSRVFEMEDNLLAATKDANGNLWIVDAAGAHTGKEGAGRREIAGPVKAPHPLTAGQNGQIWFQNQDHIYGLSPPVQFPLELHSPVALSEDHRGHLWAGGTDGKLWKLVPDSGWQQWPITDFESSEPLQIFRHSDGNLMCVSRHHIFRYLAGRDQWSRVTNHPSELRYVLPQSDGGFLASDNERGLALLSADGRLAKVIPGSDKGGAKKGFRKLYNIPSGETIIGNRVGFFRLGSNGLQSVALPSLIHTSEVHDFETNEEGTVWVGYDSGLASYQKDGSWQRLKTNLPLEMVRSFGLGRNGEFWVAHRFNGFFSHVRRDGTVRRLAIDDGYTPADTIFLKTDRRGWIWRGTSRGVYVSNGRDTNPEDWLLLELGSCKSSYGFFEDRDGTVWVATSTGVAHVTPQHSWFVDEGLPAISQAAAGDQALSSLPQEFSRTPSLLRIEFSRIGLPDFRPQPIRYRLSPRFGDWRVALDGRIDLLDMDPGSYQLDVKRAGSPSIWTHSFRIQAAPWWGSYRWTALLLLTVAGFWAYRQRELVSYRLGKCFYLLHQRLYPSPPELPGEERAGQVLNGRYRLSQLIARGGFADVYEATDTRNGQIRVVKILHHRSSDSAWVRTRFSQEVAALYSIQHPFVISLLDAWINSSGEPCMAFPLIEGENLRTSMTNGILPVEKAARLIEGLGDALSALHRAGVVHRDFKPENVIVRADGAPVVIDLGSSGFLGSAEKSAVSKILAGSVDYLAPERLTGCYSTASDVYSFGATVFELLTGSKFAETNLLSSAEDFPESLQEHMKHRAAPAVAELLAECLSPFPDRRPPDAATWARKVLKALEHPGRAVASA